MCEDVELRLKKYVIEFIRHLCKENIISSNNVASLDEKSFYDIVVLLRDIFKKEYPETKIKNLMKSIHYANNFSDVSLKESAFLLDEIEQYLSINKFLKHNVSVKYFNDKITTNGFKINPENLICVMIESLSMCKKTY